MADLCGRGLRVDIGFASHPNTYLSGSIIGIDVKKVKTPSDYWITRVASGEALPLLNRIDAICAGEVIEHFEAPITFLVECVKTLKMNGTLVLTTPNPYHPGEMIQNIFMSTKNLYADGHFYVFSYRLLFKLLELTGFHVLRCYASYCKIPGFSLCIPTPGLPTISSTIIYCAKKVRDVQGKDIFPQLQIRLRKFLENYRLEKGKCPSWSGCHPE
jgi:SAM-dependent methyltransferase